MARKTKAEALATRAQILDAAERVFAERGVARTSLHEIATAAGLTRGAVYWHFRGKYDLLAALWKRATLPLDEEFAAIDAAVGDDPLRRIREKTARVAHRVVHDARTRNILGIALLRCEMVDEIAEATPQILRERDACRAGMVGELAAARSAGQVRSDVDPEGAAIALHGMLDGLCYHWLLDPGHFDLEHVVRDCVGNWLVGLAAPAAGRATRVAALRPRAASPRQKRR